MGSVLPIHTFLYALPKCEHHLHIEGTLQPSLLFTLASRNNITLPVSDPSYASPATLLQRYQTFTSLDDFLSYYYTGMSVLLTASDFHELALSYLRSAAETGVAHVELSFDPQAHISRGVSYATVLEGLKSACEEAERQWGVSTVLICCFLRHLPADQCLELFKQEDVQRSFSDGSVMGIGLDSSELPYPPEGFKELYKRARAMKLRVTAHAGEEGPASYIASALDTLKVERIDHGIRLADDEELMARVAREGVMLTVCPLSNLVLRCVDKLEDVPIREFLDAGVRFSINSDDPAYFGGGVLDCYLKVAEAFDLSVQDWERLVKAGIEGSWCGEKRKTELLVRLEECVAKWEGKI